jgi:hypothetical protein
LLNDLNISSDNYNVKKTRGQSLVVQGKQTWTSNSLLQKMHFYVFISVIPMINMVELLVQNDIREFICSFHNYAPK